MHSLGVARLSGNGKAELFQRASHFGDVQPQAGQPLDFAEGEVNGCRSIRRVARDEELGGRSAAHLQHQTRRQFGAGQGEGRIDAALEAIARIGDDGEFAAGLGDVLRAPQRGFDQHVSGGLVAAGRLAAHHAGEQFDLPVIGDDDHAFVERIGLAVEGQQAFARFCPPHHKVSRHLGGVKHM